MDSGNVPPQRSARSLSEETEIVFALWRDEMSDEKHEDIRRLSSALQKNPKVF